MKSSYRYDWSSINSRIFHVFLSVLYNSKANTPTDLADLLIWRTVDNREIMFPMEVYHRTKRRIVSAPQSKAQQKHEWPRLLNLSTLQGNGGSGGVARLCSFSCTQLSKWLTPILFNYVGLSTSASKTNVALSSPSFLNCQVLYQGAIAITQLL